MELRRFIPKGGYFNCVCNGGCDKGNNGVRVVELLGVQSGVFILVQLLCPTCCLMCNESSSGTHEPNFSIWRLNFTHVAGVPSFF